MTDYAKYVSGWLRDRGGEITCISCQGRLVLREGHPVCLGNGCSLQQIVEDNKRAWDEVASGRRTLPRPSGSLDISLEPSGPRPCAAHDDRTHDKRSCLACSTYIKYIDRMASEAEAAFAAGEVESQRVSGGLLLDLPGVVPIWGEGNKLLAVEGQAWMIAGPDGTGKTTIAAQYAKTRLGLLPGGEMWGQPLQPLPESQSVYYLAMDRPRQAMESIRRDLTEDMRDVLNQRLFIHQGPPPHRLSNEAGQMWMLDEVGETNAGVVVVDSRKDAGNPTDSQEVLGVATMINLLVASGVEVLVLAHPNEARRNGPPDQTAVAGHGGVYHNMGSLLFLEGRPGDTLLTVHHIKPIRDRLAPFKVVHDHASGISERTEGIMPGPEKGDLVEGKMPLNAVQVQALKVIEGNADAEGWCLASVLEGALKRSNMRRDLRPLVVAEVLEHNGKPGPLSAYRLGPEAP